MSKIRKELKKILSPFQINWAAKQLAKVSIEKINSGEAICPECGKIRMDKIFGYVDNPCQCDHSDEKNPTYNYPEEKNGK